MEELGYAAGSSRALRLLEDRWLAMSKEEMAAELEKINALGLSVAAGAALERFLMPLLLQQDPELAFTWFIAHPAGDKKEFPSFNFKKWAREDPAAVEAWLDRQIAAGKLDYKSLSGREDLRAQCERALLAVLLPSAPAGAARRLAALPEARRTLVLRDPGFALDCPFWKYGASDQAAFAKLVREQIPVGDQAAIFGGPVNLLSSQGGFPAVTAYLDGIEATPAVRAACAEMAAVRIARKLASDRTVTRDDLDEMREWAKVQAPDAVDEITGKVLAEATAIPSLSSDGPRPSTKLTFAEAAALADYYHAASGNDAVIISFLNGRAANQNREQAKALAGKIIDDQLRAEALKKF